MKAKSLFSVSEPLFLKLSSAPDKVNTKYTLDHEFMEPIKIYGLMYFATTKFESNANRPFCFLPLQAVIPKSYDLTA